MRIHILTLFPGMFQGPFSESMLKRAVGKGLVDLRVHDIRDYTHDRHATADDYPYGGGPGMVLKPEPVFEAVKAIKLEASREAANGASVDMPVVLLSPQGRTFNQSIAGELSREAELILICGHYGGVDERVQEHLATDEISIGDYILTGGELAAMVIVDAMVRLIPGVLGSEESAQEDSFASGLLQHPQYTRPANYRGWAIPDVLLSGDHSRIALWRRQQALLHTFQRRPDLLKKLPLTEEDRRFLVSFKESTLG